MLTRRDWFALLFLVAGMVSFACLYVTHERAYYVNDWNFYQIATWFSKEQFLANPITMPLLVILSTGSTGLDLVCTVPLLPLAILLGDSRLSYIVDLVVSYLVPYLILLGLIMTHAINCQSVPGQKSGVFWVAVLSAITVPALWAPTLRGYPDTGAAAIILLCILLYLGDIEQRSLRRALVIGFLLALAALFRRHYLYASFAFVASVFIHVLVRIFLLSETSSSQRFATFARQILTRFVPMGLSASFVMLTLGFLAVQEKWTHRYMYAGTSASVSLPEAVGYFFTTYGAITWLLAISGYVLGLKLGILQKREGSFVLIFGLTSVTVWMVLAQQLAIHYTLYCDPLVSFGLASLVCVIMSRPMGAARVASFITIAISTTINCLFGFLPMTLLNGINIHPTQPGMLVVPWSEGDPISRLFSSNYAPLSRDDFEQMEALVKFLRAIAPGRERIVITGQSDWFDLDAVRNAERQIYGGMKASRLNLLDVSFLDSRDSYPLGRILQAQYLVLATPTFSIYKASTTTLLKVLVASFTEGWTISEDFVDLGKQFDIDRGVKLRIYKRIRPTSVSTAIATLEKMRSLLSIRPGGQPAWISTDDPSAQTGEEKKDSFRLQASTPDKLHGPAHYLLSAFPLPTNFAISGKIKERMPVGSALFLRIYDVRGNVTAEKSFPISSTDGAFNLSVKGLPDSAVTISLETNAEDSSPHSDSVILEKLQILPISP